MRDWWCEGDLAIEVQGSAMSGVGRGSHLRQQSDLNGVALQVSAHAFSASARDKITAAGGSVTEL